ncbi:GGDEF domain-containing protein [Persephonella atlantica]|uniref:diguanylate cyclase n=1 Tax=Persephonella atlantica TaxID=2699429 RepID=A0ABS1GJR1_9AQUI|nr:GGDEF domain-containing protein [Persephonella atlantica]MBK3333066.1 GGDEF domain-containing protein [Persephonella atlantica]
MDAKIKKSALIYIFSFIFLSILIWLIFDSKKNQNKQIYLNQKIVKAAAEFTTMLNGYRMLIDFVNRRYFGNTELLHLIYAAEKGKNSEKYIRLIKRKIKPLLDDMKRYQIDYIQIKTPDGKVLLGFRKKSSKKNRQIRIFNVADKEIIGGFKFTYELYYNNILLGSTEIILSYEAIKDQLKKIFKGEYLFLIYRDVIEKRVGEKKSYVQSEISPLFFYETGKNSKYQIPVEILSKINLELKEKAGKKLKKFQNFAVDVEVNGNNYVVSFIVISDVTGKKIGYLVYYELDNTVKMFNDTFTIMYLSVEVALFAMLSFLINIRSRSEKFKLLSEIDRLTGIYNKAKFNQVLESELKKVKRYNRPLGLIIFDIDHFKKINDTYGHQTGDYVLKTIAEIVKKNVRDTDIFARWGGEEFVIVAPETDLSGTKILAEKLRKAIEEHRFDKVGKVTASFGVTEAVPEDTTDSIVRRADEALYLAKEKGRNRVEIMLPEI